MSNKSSSVNSTFDNSSSPQNDVVHSEPANNACTAYRLDIPAVDFCHNTNKRANPSPPSRLLHSTPPSSTPLARRKRQHSAATARSAALHTRRTRCHQQTLHAAAVARSVRDTRLNASTQRRTAIRDQLDRASHKKKSLQNSMRDVCATTVTSALKKPAGPPESPPISPSSVVAAAASQSLDAACDIHDKRLAAKTVSAHFLLSRSRRILRHMGLLGSAIKSASFDSVAARLQTTPALIGARLALRAVDIYLSTELCTTEVSPRRPGDFRILFSALLVASHPDVVINSPLPTITGMARITSNDADVIAKARAVAFALHSPSVRVLALAWKSWRPAFLEWKARDRPLLIDALIASALATAEKMRAASGVFSAVTEVVHMHDRLTGDSDAGGLDSIGVGNHDAWLADVRRAVAAVGGPAGIKRLDDALERAERERGEKLMHEVLLDPQGLAASLCSVTMVPAEAWERMRKQLSETPSQLDETSTRLAFVRKMLVSLGSRAAKTQWPCIEHSGELDTNFVCAIVDTVAAGCMECQAEVFDVSVQRWANDAKMKVRQVGTRNMTETSSLAYAAVDTLVQATDLVSGVYAHVVSWRVQRAASNVATYGVMWERARFSEHVTKGEMNVRRTKDWIRKSHENLTTNNVTDEAKESRNEIWEAVIHGIVNLILPVTYTNLRAGSQLDEETVPEVLVMDVLRLRRIGCDIRRCAIASALYHTMRACGSVDISGESVEEWVDRVVEASEGEDLDNVIEEWMDECRDMNELNTQSETNIGVLKGMARRVASGNDETYRLMVRRVCKVVIGECVRRRTLGMLPSSSATPPSSSATPPSASASSFPHSVENGVTKELLKRAGLPEVVELVDSTCSQVFRLVSHIVTVHGDRLFQLINDAGDS